MPAAAATPDGVATLIAALEKIFAAKRGETLGPSFTSGFVMSWRNHTEPTATWQMLLPCDSDGKVLWVSEAWEAADDSDHMCLVTLPLKHRPLWMVRGGRGVYSSANVTLSETDLVKGRG